MQALKPKLQEPTAPIPEAEMEIDPSSESRAALCEADTGCMKGMPQAAKIAALTLLPEPVVAEEDLDHMRDMQH